MEGPLGIYLRHRARQLLSGKDESWRIVARQPQKSAAYLLGKESFQCDFKEDWDWIKDELGDGEVLMERSKEIRMIKKWAKKSWGAAKPML